jgi:hypothetical protein
MGVEGNGGGAPPKPPPPPDGGDGASQDQEHPGTVPAQPTEYKGSIISEGKKQDKQNIGETFDQIYQSFDPTHETKTPLTPTEPPITPPIEPPKRPEEPPTGPPPKIKEAPQVILDHAIGRSQICCIGFNPEDSKLEIIIKIDKTDGWGSKCTKGAVAHVGSWIKAQPVGFPNFVGSNNYYNKFSTDPQDSFTKQDPTYFFLGDTTVRVFGKDGNILGNAVINFAGGGGGAEPGPQVVNYALHIPLPPDIIAYIRTCDKLQCVPHVHCVLTITNFDTVTKDLGGTDLKLFHFNTFALNASNFNGNGLPANTFSIAEADIPFPKKSTWGKWEYYERRGNRNNPNFSKYRTREAFTDPVHAVLLKNRKILFFSGLRVPDGEQPFALFDPDTLSFQGIQGPNTHFIMWDQVLLPKNTVYNTFNDDKYFAPSSNLDTILEVPDPDNPAKLDDLNAPHTAKVHEIFCSGHNSLPDGRVIILGGQENTPTTGAGDPTLHAHHDKGIRQVSIYDPDNNSWSTISPAFRNGRWYPGSVVMGDGRVFVMDGHPDSQYSDDYLPNNPLIKINGYLDFEKVDHANIDLEIFNPANNNWTYEKCNNATYTFEERADIFPGAGYFPRMLLLADGSVFCANPLQSAPGSRLIEKDFLQKKYYSCRWDVKAKQWIQVTTNEAYADQYTTAVLMPIRYTLTQRNDPITSKSYIDRPVYDDTKNGVLLYSGFGSFPNGADTVQKSSVLVSFPLSQNQGQRNWQILKTFAQERNAGNIVLLPDGTVMFLGGTDAAARRRNKYANNILDYPNLSVDIYDPSTNIWVSGAPDLRVRDYHSLAVPLYDGRVLLCGTQPPNDTSVEIYTPDYLMRGPRPEFVVTPDVIGHDQRLRITLAKGWRFKHLRKDKCGLLRCYGVTHGFGFDQRYVNLHPIKAENIPPFSDDVTARAPLPGFGYPEPDPDDMNFDLEIPANPNLLPPGYYMLFLQSQIEAGEAGCISIGHFIRIV